jgi:hypothetical protein
VQVHERGCMQYLMVCVVGRLELYMCFYIHEAVGVACSCTSSEAGMQGAQQHAPFRCSCCRSAAVLVIDSAHAGDAYTALSSS